MREYEFRGHGGEKFTIIGNIFDNAELLNK